MDLGWIKLHRSLLDHPIMEYKNVSIYWFFCYCLLNANHTSHKIDYGGEEKELRPGQFVYGRISWSRRLKVSESTIRNWIEKLKKWDMIEDSHKDSFKGTIYQIKNWDKYQSKGQALGQVLGQREDSEVSTNKNDKNDKNDKREIYISLSPNQILKLMNEFNISEHSVRWELDNLQTFCRSQGKTYANYFETMRAWIKKDILNKKIVRALPKFNSEEHTIDQEGLKRIAQMKKKFKLS